MTEAYQDRGSGGRRLITARQFLADLDQREGLAGVHAQRFQHFRGQYLADAALQSQPTVAKTAVGRPSRSRSEEHTSELQSLMPISYAAFGFTKKQNANI